MIRGKGEEQKRERGGRRVRGVIGEGEMEKRELDKDRLD